MIELLALNAAVDLAVGLALLGVWRAERSQAFARSLGWSFVVQALAAPAYVTWQRGAAPWPPLGAALLVVSVAAGVALWIAGAAELCRRAPERRHVWWGFAALLAVGAGALAVDPRVAGGLAALLTTLGGGVALAGLWRVGGHERVAGVTMLLLGLTQLAGVFSGGAGLSWQASIATGLRVVLGLALLHAAVARRGGEAARLRDQLMQLVERSHQGVAVMQGETMKYANPALLRIYGLPADGGALIATEQRWRDATIAEDERDIARARHRRIVAGEVAQDHWEGERRSFDGRPLHLRFSAWRVEWDGAPAEQIVVTDDTAQVDATRTLLQQATHDELTGLPNRSALQQRLRALCATTPPQPFSLLLLDVDRFKLFNEAHGPSVGDAVLRALAERLVSAIGRRAEVMRFGEDEFALLAIAADAERAARDLAATVRQCLLQPLELPQHRFFLDVSIGIALYPATATAPDALLRSANAAMHEAKRTPGTSVQFAEERFERGSGATLEAEQALRAGMKSDEFALVYQPKVDARSGALVGFEALARWERPGIGTVEPSEFIPAAERTGLIGPLGNLILTLACHQIADWRETFGRMVPVAVNVSPLQLLDPGFPDLVMRTLRHFNLSPELLTLEITESAAVTHMGQAREQIGQLRAHGVQVALDDFGTGFSSLNMLRSLPLSTVKIDRTLIDPMPAPDADAVVRAICDLAGALGLEVVAEGVETAAHARAAADAGCGVLQGYLYARPLAPAEAAQWMRGRPEFKSPAGGGHAVP